MRNQNWFAAWLDFAIVVIGILIAFQITNWSARQDNKKTAREYIERIQEDLLANQEDIKSRIGYYEGIKNHGIRTLSALEQPREELGGAFLVDAYQASNVIAKPIGRDAYDELLSVGAINIITDVQVRKHLAEYYYTNAGFSLIIETIPAYRNAVRSVIPFDVQVEIRSQCRPIVDVVETGIRSISLPESCVVDLADEQVQRSVGKIYDAELKNHLTRAVVDAREKQDLYEGIIFFSQQLYDILEDAK